MLLRRKLLKKKNKCAVPNDLMWGGRETERNNFTSIYARVDFIKEYDEDFEEQKRANSPLQIKIQGVLKKLTI